MNYRVMGKLLSGILFLEALFMLPALFLSVYDGQSAAIRGFVWGILIICGAALILRALGRKASQTFHAREGFSLVAISWIVISVLGCLPFVFSGEIPNFIDALFEMVSGFTTTGASIVPEVERLSRGVIYWKSFSHWIGGMGVLVFLLAIVPSGDGSSGFTLHLLRAESPGPDVGKLVPRIKSSARILYLLYIGLTVLNLLFLLAGHMPLFEALCTTFGTAGTGGFAVVNDSIASYSPYIQWVCTIFMMAFGVNFTCWYLVVLGRFRAVLRDEELRAYLCIAGASIFLIVLNIRNMYETLGETIRHASFQVASIMTTTGYATTDFDLWPSFSKAILLALMIVGACAGSTCGGLKVGRFLLLVKGLKRNARQLLRPNKVETVRNNGRMVPEKVLNNTNAYLAAYVMIVVGSVILVSIDGFSLTTNLSAVLATFNNIGPGLDMVGPTCSFAVYSGFSKIVLIIDMLAGRLEIFPMLILLSRSTWRYR